MRLKPLDFYSFLTEINSVSDQRDEGASGLLVR